MSNISVTKCAIVSSRGVILGYYLPSKKTLNIPEVGNFFRVYKTGISQRDFAPSMRIITLLRCATFSESSFMVCIIEPPIFRMSTLRHGSIKFNDFDTV